MRNYIWIKGHKYYYYDTYSTYDEAYSEAKYFRHKYNSRWFILRNDKGFLFPNSVYKLYMNKVRRLFG